MEHPGVDLEEERRLREIRQLPERRRRIAFRLLKENWDASPRKLDGMVRQLRPPLDEKEAALQLQVVLEVQRTERPRRVSVEGPRNPSHFPEPAPAPAPTHPRKPEIEPMTPKTLRPYVRTDRATVWKSIDAYRHLNPDAKPKDLVEHVRDVLGIEIATSTVGYIASHGSEPQPTKKKPAPQPAAEPPAVREPAEPPRMTQRPTPAVPEELSFTEELVAPAVPRIRLGEAELALLRYAGASDELLERAVDLAGFVNSLPIGGEA